jgi:hypothetical protein
VDYPAFCLRWPSRSHANDTYSWSSESDSRYCARDLNVATRKSSRATYNVFIRSFIPRFADFDYQRRAVQRDNVGMVDLCIEVVRRSSITVIMIVFVIVLVVVAIRTVLICTVRAHLGSTQGLLLG